MKVGSVMTEGTGSWCQVVDANGRVWTIRAQVVTIEEIDFYECWVNDVVLPMYWRRQQPTGEECLGRVFAAGLAYIEGHNAAP